MDRPRILLLDSECSFANELVAELADRGIEAEVAADSVSAFESMLRHRPHLILVSQQTPGASQVQQHARKSHIPSVLRGEGKPAEFAYPGATLSAAACLPADQGPAPIADALADLVQRARVGELPAEHAMALNLLVVEDEFLHCETIRKSLGVGDGQTIALTFAHSVADACELLQRESFDCVIVDHHLPDGSGLDLLQQAQEWLLTVPVIGLSGGDDPSIALEYFREGCIDFFAKGHALSADHLRKGIADALSRFHRRALATLVSRQQLGSSVMNSQEGLIALARSDRLMGICNRAAFDDFLPNYHREMEAHDRSYAICLADVDHFKFYNDDHGHVAGDEALRDVAQGLASTLRGNDFISRYGGEEIVIVLDGISPQDLPAVADRLRSRVFELDQPHRRNLPHGRITVSLGAAMFEPGSGQTAAQLIAHADQALYQAKAQGRNCVVIAGSNAAGQRLSA